MVLELPGPQKCLVLVPFWYHVDYSFGYIPGSFSGALLGQPEPPIGHSLGVGLAGPWGRG